MRNFSKTFGTNMEAAYDKIDGFCHIYFNRMYSETGTKNDADMFFLLAHIRRCLVSIMEHSECPDMNIKTVFHEFIRLSQFIHQIQSFMSDGIGGEELGNVIKEVSSLIDPQMLSVDVSVYESNIVSETNRPEKDGNEIVLEKICMEDTTFSITNGVFNHLYRLGYLSRPHKLVEEFDEDGEFKGVVLNIALYENKADDLADFLKIFSKYAYNNKDNEYDFGWNFNHIANVILDNITESRKCKNFQLTQYIYNAVVYGNPNPFGGESKTDNK